MYQERIPCVYILASQPRGTLYVGITFNLPSRIWQQKNDQFDSFTKPPVVVIQQTDTLSNVIPANAGTHFDVALDPSPMSGQDQDGSQRSLG